MKNVKKNVKVILFGNKTNLEDKRVVKSEEGAGLDLENDYIFLETSCLKNTNVSTAFETLIENTNIETQKNSRDNIRISRGGVKSNKIFCCL